MSAQTSAQTSSHICCTSMHLSIHYLSPCELFSPRDYPSIHCIKFITVLQDFDTIPFLSDKCGALYLILIVDDDDGYPEVDETNNRIVRNLLKPCSGIILVTDVAKDKLFFRRIQLQFVQFFAFTSFIFRQTYFGKLKTKLVKCIFQRVMVRLPCPTPRQIKYGLYRHRIVWSFTLHRDQ